jgi:hypothetical protein
MNSLSIRVKVIALVLLGVGAVTTVVGLSVGRAFDRNQETMAKQSMRNAQAAFASLVGDDVSKLGATGKVLLDSPSLVKAFVDRDRERLLAEASRTYPELVRDFGITHMNFITPDRKIFLRMTKPSQFDDLIERVTLANAISTAKLAAGLELGKTGFVLRTVRPVTDGGAVVGYLELGEEIGSFSSRLKTQTGFDLGVLLAKKHLREDDWGFTRSAQGLRNNWADKPDVVVAQTTTSDEHLFEYSGGLEAIPPEGLVLEQLATTGKVLMRGIFPIHDAAGKPVGSVFVLTDITELNTAIAAARSTSLVITVALLALLSGLVWLVLDRLVFRRLAAMGARLEELSLRVAGGDFDLDTGIAPTAGGDEIHRLEQFLAQFLVLIGSTLKALCAPQKGPE